MVRRVYIESGELMQKGIRRGHIRMTPEPPLPPRKRRRKKRKTGLQRLFRFVVLLFVIILVYGGYVLYEAYDASQSLYYALERGEKSELRENTVKIADDPVSILILGVEEYATEGQNGRTDTIMLVTLNPYTKSMKMISIPRDTRIEIVGKDREDKINHAHAFGGTEMAIETVEKFLNVPIDYFIKINFEGFIDIVDEIGGITVDVPFDFSENTTKKGEKAYFKKGPMHLTGEEALAYARMRKQDPRGDFGRNDRQKQVLKASIDQALTMTTLFKVDKITDHIGDNIQTNLKPMEILALQKKYATIDTSTIDNLTIDGSDHYENGVYYFIPNEMSVDSLQIRLRVHLNLD